MRKYAKWALPTAVAIALAPTVLSLLLLSLSYCTSEEVEIWTVVAKRENPNKGSWFGGGEYEIAFDNGETRSCEWGLYLSLDSGDRFEITKRMGRVKKVTKLEND